MQAELLSIEHLDFVVFAYDTGAVPIAKLEQFGFAGAGPALRKRHEAVRADGTELVPAN
jgi:hypothetical protein